MKIIGLGDSLMQFNGADTYPQSGWFQELNRFVKDPMATPVWDFAKNGSSTKSIQTLGFYDSALQAASKGDLVLIEFGHNDEKKQDPLRYTEPYKEYKDNLKKFYQAFSSKGAQVVFCTSVSRVKYDPDGIHLLYTHGDYPKAMKEAGKEVGAQVIDLEALSKKLYEEGGKEFTLRCIMTLPSGLYENYPEGKSDTSHLTDFGAVHIAGLVVQELKKISGLCNLFQENKIRSASPNMPFEP